MTDRGRWKKAKADLEQALVGPRAPAQLRFGEMPRATGVDLRVDPGGDRLRVASLVKASRVVLSSVSSSDHIVEVGGEKMRAGELLARAAQEHGEPDTAARIRRSFLEGPK